MLEPGEELLNLMKCAGTCHLYESSKMLWWGKAKKMLKNLEGVPTIEHEFFAKKNEIFNSKGVNDETS